MHNTCIICTCTMMYAHVCKWMTNVHFLNTICMCMYSNVYTYMYIYMYIHVLLYLHAPHFLYIVHYYNVHVHCVLLYYNIHTSFMSVFHLCFQPSIKFIRKSAKEIVSTVDGNLTFSLIRILDCFFKPFIPQEEVHCIILHIHVHVISMYTIKLWYLYNQLWIYMYMYMYFHHLCVQVLNPCSLYINNHLCTCMYKCMCNHDLHVG